MSQTHRTVPILARLSKSRGVELRTSQPLSSSQSGERSAIALDALSTALNALKEASGLVSVPALREVTCLALVLLEGVQVSRNSHIFQPLTIQIREFQGG
jgi:hypothetical protein